LSELYKLKQTLDVEEGDFNPLLSCAVEAVIEKCFASNKAALKTA
jgi:hypothetical protein